MDVRLRAANRLTQPCIMFTYCPSVCNRTEAFSNRRVCVCDCCWIYSLVNEGFYFTHASGKNGDIVQSACLCISVCPLAYLKNRICVPEINTQWSLERHYFVYTLSMFNQCISVYWVGLCLLVYFYLYFVYYCLYLCSLPVYILVNKAVY